MPKGGYENLEVLRSILFEFIEGYYNRQRLHSSLKYEIPMDFETQWLKKNSEKCKYLTRKTRKKCKPKIDHLTHRNYYKIDVTKIEYDGQQITNIIKWH